MQCPHCKATPKVSIRARHHWRAIPSGWRFATVLKVFQSAPAITGGRSRLKGESWIKLKLFQSAPAITGGRSCPHGLTSPNINQVSIRARHHWRAIRGECRRQHPSRSVSIRARHHWRAILPQPPPPHPQQRFQSAPAITGGRSTVPWCFRSTAFMFQSAPAITGGRSRPSTASSSRPNGFNPRPPSLAGDPAPVVSNGVSYERFNPRPPSLAGDPFMGFGSNGLHQFQSAPAITGGRSPVDATASVRFPLVSIRARHHWRAIQHSWKTWVSSQKVSIRARHHWRAIRHGGYRQRPQRQFQSAPAITGGRSAKYLAQASSEDGFQSAPAITGGRSYQLSTGETVSLCFNPRPPSLAGDPISRSCCQPCQDRFNPRPPSLAGDPSARMRWLPSM